MKTALIAAVLATSATTGIAAPVKYVLEPGHSQVLFSYDHLGFSTSHGMFSGFEGEIMFDQENPENSTVMVSMPVTSMLTGWQERFTHLMSDEFFGADADDMITFKSTAIEVTGEDTAKISGELTLNDVTRPVVLDARLNQVGTHPMEGKPWAGFDATTALVRSDYNLGKFAPFVGDEVTVSISVEAKQAE